MLMCDVTFQGHSDSHSVTASSWSLSKPLKFSESQFSYLIGCGEDFKCIAMSIV